MLTREEEIELAQLEAEEAQYLQKKEAEKEGFASQVLGHAGRTAAGAVGGIGDLATALVNVPSILATGKSIIPSAGAALKDKYDTLTEGRYAPTSLPGKISQSLVELIVGGGALRKAATKGAHLAHPVLQSTINFIQKLTKPTAANLGAATGATTTAHLAHELAPDSERIPLIAGMVGGFLGGGAGRKLEYSKQLAKNVKNVFGEGESGAIPWRDLRRDAALRSEYGPTVEAQLPLYYGLEEGFLGKPQMSEVGSLASQSAQRYTDRMHKKFNKSYGEIKNRLDKTLSKAPSQERQVSLSGPIHLLLDRYKEASLDPITAKTYLNGPLGRELAHLLGVERLTPKQVHHLQASKSNRLNRTVDYETADRLRKDLDERIKSREWSQVGGKAGTLKELRHELMEEYSKFVKDVNPKVHKRLQETNTEFSHHMEKEAPWVEDIRSRSHHLGDTASRALRDVGTTAEDVARLYRDLNPGEAKTITDYLLRDLGEKEGKISSRKLTRSLEDLQGKEFFDVLKRAMNPEEFQKVQSLMKAQSNLEAIRGEPKGLADISQTTGGLTRKARAKKMLVKNIIGSGLNKPEGMVETIKYLENYKPKELDLSALVDLPEKAPHSTRAVISALSGLKP